MEVSRDRRRRDSQERGAHVSTFCGANGGFSCCVTASLLAKPTHRLAVRRGRRKLREIVQVPQQRVADRPSQCGSRLEEQCSRLLRSSCMSSAAALTTRTF